MKALEIVRFVCKRHGLPLDDAWLDTMMWEYTGFPEWWNIGVDGRTNNECFYTQLDRAARVIKNHSGQFIDPLEDYRIYYQ